MFALLSLVAEESESHDTAEQALEAVDLCGGFFELMVDPTTGEIVKVLHYLLLQDGAGRL